MLHSIVDARPRADLALVAASASGDVSRATFGEVADASRRAAGWLLGEGVARGDRVAVVLPQRPETAVLHLACSRLGAIATPLSPLFGPEGLAARLADAAPRVIVTDGRRAPVVQEARTLAGLRAGVHLVDEPLWAAAPEVARRDEARGGPDAPMWLVYTSGTTGGPKGVLLPHRVLPGRLPGFRLAHEPFGPGDVFASPADWSWIGGLLDALFAPWHEGGVVLAHERVGAFDPAATLNLYARHGVTHAFLPPTALKAVARGGATPATRLRVVQSAGEPLPPPVRAWAQRALADSVTEVYGLTEAAYLVGTATRAYATPADAMGRPYPGHRVEVVEEEIRVRAGDPTLMLGYWQGEGRAPDLPLDEEGRFRTGDLARMAEDGFLRFLGRRDDLIKTSGYRVGPAEVEACLLHHAAVAECAVVGVPDEQRGQAIKAFVKVAAGAQPGPDLERALREHVRARLAAHAYPREIAFVDELPLTVTGKIRRRELRLP